MIVSLVIQSAREMAAAPECVRKMATTTTPRHVTAAIHELSQVTADLHESSQVTADRHEASHISVDRPESCHISTIRPDLPKPHHI